MRDLRWCALARWAGALGGRVGAVESRPCVGASAVEPVCRHRGASRLATSLTLPVLTTAGVVLARFAGLWFGATGLASSAWSRRSGAAVQLESVQTVWPVSRASRRALHAKSVARSVRLVISVCE